MGGLDVYSGYWLAADSPANGTEDALQEEGIDTLRRVMEAAGINFYNENGSHQLIHLPSLDIQIISKGSRCRSIPTNTLSHAIHKTHRQ